MFIIQIGNHILKLLKYFTSLSASNIVYCCFHVMRNLWENGQLLHLLVALQVKFISVI